MENFDKRFLTWGYFLAFNSYDFKIDYIEQYTDSNTDVIVETQSGFNVGLIGDMRISSYINLRLEPGLYITKRELNYHSSYFNGVSYNDSDLLREVNSTYIHFPLLLKYFDSSNT